MSELMNRKHRNIRWELLATVSALTLFAAVDGLGTSNAADQDADRPTVWIELGAQSEQVSGFGGGFAPPFTSEIIADGFVSPLKTQKALSQSFGGESTISFQPEDSDWIFSASLLYGRANGRKFTHEQTPTAKHARNGTQTATISPIHYTKRFSETQAVNNETHAILDFQVGKDIGLGLFNTQGSSNFNFGLRVAQFTAKQSLRLNADPDFYFPSNIFSTKYHHTYAVESHMQRSFRGFGPSISWKASAPAIGRANDGGLSLDWGVNAAILFGRQKASGHHQTVAGFYKSNDLAKYNFVSHFQRSGDPDRSHTVVVPNVGGFAGASFRFSNAKVSLGYRADFFFGAMDGGIDTRKSETLGFYGPFASISVGIGG
jgi:iron complex outermembrane receptor protein